MPIVLPTRTTSSSSLDLSQVQCTQFYRNTHKRRMSSADTLHSITISASSSSNSSPMSSPVMSPAKKKNRPPEPKFVGRDPYNTLACLDEKTASKLQCYLPPRVAIASRWRLLYSTDQHGTSASTLHRRVEAHKGPCLLVIVTAEGEQFGAYVSETLQCQPRYYGSGECFLWRRDKAEGIIEHYPCTGVNDYVVYTDRDFLAFGGGVRPLLFLSFFSSCRDGRAGLWLHKDLIHGHTENCVTFNNAPLTEHDSNFDCLALEVWGFEF
ncbi:TLD-domain-containing protein [Syncephalastrum racemosum]|uniref:Oxidation resistance protein 1 n=1 Tax=Syncephalastrum racemosum TaxID=13706 RepID=A0A1X2H6S9_SYNRA|nr:TLD-domain-containing protein [Syncephalastrum racemosum]